MWSVLAALYPVQRDGERVWKYKDHESDLNVKDISFPVKMDDIPVVFLWQVHADNKDTNDTLFCEFSGRIIVCSNR
jgi:hypothetical protein